MKKAYNGLILSALIICAGLLSSCGQQKAKQVSGTEQDSTEMVGNDKDEHGCIASAGYTWSEVQQNCIRLFESGIRLEAIDGKSSAYLVFSPDSLKAELFFSNDTPNDILDRRSLPAGDYAWNIEDDDTKNVRRVDGVWMISQRGKEIYRQNKKDADNSLGDIQTQTYEGVLPCADCPGIRYDLTIRSREKSGEGTFSLSQTYLEAEDGKDATFVTNGKCITLQDIPGEKNVTVWQLVSDNEDEVMNFLCENDSTITLIGDDFKKAETELNYSLKKVQK